MKKNIFNSIILYLIIISTSFTGCDSETDKTNFTDNTSDDTPVWETSVITPKDITEYVPENQPNFNNSNKALGYPYGGGTTNGSIDVVSLGFDETAEGGYIILRFDKTIINGDGVDFKVFENAFSQDATFNFIEAARVFLSEDGSIWYEFPNSFSGDVNNLDDTQNPFNYSGFAGIWPVLSNWKVTGSPKPEDADSGGDFFDLEEMIEPIKSNGFKYIKIVDAGITIKDSGNITNSEGDYTMGTSGFDLDAVVGINYQ